MLMGKKGKKILPTRLLEKKILDDQLNGRPLIYLSLKTDENQEKQIKIRCCTWAFCATVHKDKVYVLRLKVTHTALVNT